MKFVFKISAVLTLFPMLLAAQSNFKQGYAVTTGGDTLRGYINYRGWDTNPDKIVFKKDKSSPVQELTPANIVFFSVGKSTSYKRYTGPISMDNTSEVHMSENRDTTFKVTTVFLRVLQKGKNVALYSYSDAIKTRLFIGDQPGYEPVELVYRLYWDVRVADPLIRRGRTVNENTYMRQLYALALKYNAFTPLLQKDIEDSGYRDYYVGEIVKKINSVK